MRVLLLFLMALLASPSQGWISSAWQEYVDSESERALEHLAAVRPECTRYPFFDHKVWRDLAASGKFKTSFSDRGRKFVVEFQTNSGGVFGKLMDSLSTAMDCSHSLDEQGSWRVNKYYLIANLAGDERKRHFWLDGDIADSSQEWSFTFDKLQWCGKKNFTLKAKFANTTVELLNLKNLELLGHLPLTQVEKGFTWAELRFDPEKVEQCLNTRPEKTFKITCFGRQYEMRESETLHISGLLPMIKDHSCNVTDESGPPSVVTFETKSDLPPVVFTAHDSALALVANQPDFIMTPDTAAKMDCHVTVTDMATNVTRRVGVWEAATVGVNGLKPNGHYRACLVMQERPQKGLSKCQFENCLINTRCYSVYTLPTRTKTTAEYSVSPVAAGISNSGGSKSSSDTVQIVLLTLTMLWLFCLCVVIFWQHKRLRALGAPTASFFKMETCHQDSNDNNNLI